MGTAGTLLVGSMTPRKNPVSGVSANRAVAQNMSVAANLFICGVPKPAYTNRDRHDSCNLLNQYSEPRQ